MSIWKPTSVEETPEIELGRWTIFEVENGDRHFCGYNITEGSSRVSSKIVEFDKERMTGKTNSGRVYKLVGHNAANLDAMYVWDVWCRLNQVTCYKDVSEEI